MLDLLSPAKINLFFRVLKKREDGFHEIASLYQAIDLFDEITLELSSEDSFSCTDPTLDLGPANLVMQALTLFRQKTGIFQPVSIHLVKNTPIQSGLGGGSSNAATTLWALNEYFGSPATVETLQQWSAELGSDVPFFFSEGTAYCEGKGELVQNLSPFPFSAWIVKPSFGLSTPLVYQHTKVSSLTQRDCQEAMNRILSEQAGYFNDLETAAYHIEPRLKAFKEQLVEMGFQEAFMTGSGTAFFCFGNPDHLSDHSFYFVQNTQRKSNAWYSSSEYKEDAYAKGKDL